MQCLQMKIGTAYSSHGLLFTRQPLLTGVTVDVFICKLTWVYFHQRASEKIFRTSAFGNFL